MRPQEPEQRAPRRVELKDPRAGNASVRRFYLAPSHAKADKGEAEALYLLMKIAGNGSTSRLYQKLVAEEKVAASAGGWYSGAGLDSGSIGVYAVAAEGVGLDKVEQAIDAVLHELREKRCHGRRAGARQEGVHRRVHLRVRQPGALARRYGEGLVARHDHRADQQLAGGHRQGDGRRRASAWPPSIWISAAR